MNFNTLILPMLALLSVSANSHAAKTNLSYDFIEVGHENMAPPDNSGDFTGFNITKSKTILDNIVLAAGYSKLTHREAPDEFDVVQSGYKFTFETFKVSVGYAKALNNSVDFFTTVSIFDKEFRLNGVYTSAQVNGIYTSMSLDTKAYGVGLRNLVSDNLELNTSLSYHDVKDDEVSGTVLEVGGVYKLNDKFSATASFAKDNGFETDHIEVGLRYHF